MRFRRLILQDEGPDYFAYQPFIYLNSCDIF